MIFMMENNNVISACEDVVVEILHRLPEKPLIRCKCVCKAWNRLINDVCIPRYSINPRLSCLNIRTASSPRIVGKDNARKWYYYIESNIKCGPSKFILNTKGLPFHHPAHCLLNSCNGLLLFYSSHGLQYYVCNPTTKEFMLLPSECKFINCFSAALAFDPWKSPHFKVVCFCLSGDTHLQIQIYSSISCHWDEYTFPLTFHPPIDMWMDHLVYLDGNIYLFTLLGHLIWFDLSVMKISQIGLPQEGGLNLADEYHDGGLGASMGRLCFMLIYISKLKVWFLSDDEHEGKKWILKHNICISGVLKRIPSSMKRSWKEASPFGFHPNSDIVYFGSVMTVISYDCKSKTFKKLIRTTERGPRFGYPILSHFRCLVSLANIRKKCIKSIDSLQNYNGRLVLHLDWKF